MQKHLTELLVENYQTLGVTYNNEVGADATSMKRYTFKAPLHMRFVLGDKVAVVGGDGVSMKVGTVEELHETPQIDFSATFKYSWIIGIVDMTPYNEQKKFEAEFDKTMVEVEREQKRAELLETYNTTLPSGSKARGMLDKLLGGFGRLTKKDE